MGTGTGGSSFLFILLAFAVLWFLMIRPSQQQAKKRAEMLNQLKPGVKIVTIGGICGVIKALTENRVFLEIADGLTIEMLRTSISQVITDEEASEEDEDDEYEDDDDEEYEDDEDKDEEQK